MSPLDLVAFQIAAGALYGLLLATALVLIAGESRWAHRAEHSRRPTPRLGRARRRPPNRPPGHRRDNGPATAPTMRVDW